MSDALTGSDVVNHGAAFGMVRFRPVAGLSLAAMDYNVQDLVNTSFGQVEYDFKQPKGVPNWCPSADDLRLIRRFEKGGSGSSGLEFKRPAADAASGGLRWLYA